MIKSIVNAPICEKKHIPFPKLMKLRKSGAIILAVDYNGHYHLGTVVHGVTDQNQTVGYRSNAFVNAEDFDGTITLSNE